MCAFIAIIGDIRNSRELELRKEIQDRLKKTLEEINIKYKKNIQSKFVITLGDEFQGLLLEGEKLLHVIQYIRMKLYPVEVRFGIGVGEITTDINTEMALGADGPAYYRARDAIEIMKANEKKNRTVESDIRLENDNMNQKMLINTIFELIRVIEQNWTERQREIIWNLSQYQDGQQKTADRIGITQSAVHKALTKGNYYVYEKAMKNVEEVLGEIKI
ncbi:MAG: hypothetical protein HFJ10_12595 [Lachnospiraceae bacterium]|jgi:hypothetical protein|nr:hypothetical protein [Lachnospiraceae bacterium]